MLDQQRHILVVLPHPDDESFGIAGSLAQYIQAGATVTYICLTMGEMGRNMGMPIIANRVTLPAIRKKELEQSCAAIGIQDLRLFGLHDKTVEFEPPEQLSDRIQDVINEVQPTLIITFYPGYSVHPDHDATGAAVIRAVARMPAHSRPTVRCVAFSNNCEAYIGKPDTFIPIEDGMAAKIASFQAHHSQFGHIGSEKPLDELKAMFATERFWTYRFD